MSATARSPAACRKGATAANTVIAYEPVWAIGTGKTPTADEIAAMHAHIRGAAWCERLGDGGARHAHSLWRLGQTGQCRAKFLTLPEVDGALVGGASLKAEDFLAHYRAALSRFNQFISTLP